MKKTLVFLVSTALLLGTISGPRACAGDGDCGLCETDAKDAGLCDTCCPTEQDDFCHYLPDVGRLHFYGWLDAGFVGNTSSPASRFNGPYNAVDRSNELMFNQAYLVS